MFKNRAINISVNKSGPDKTTDAPSDPKEFEKKAEIILRKLENLGAKMFLGVCVYVVLDTHRQVAIEKAKT